MTAPAPDDAALRRFLLGTLPPADAESVTRWVENDPSAAARLAAVDARDPVVDAAVSASLDTDASWSSVPVAPQTAPASGHPTEPDPLPLAVGDYRIVRELGRGGMGVVGEAENAISGRRVAVKLIAPGLAADPAARARFLGEARAAARVEHPNVVPILHVGEAAGRPYIVMPLLAGETLDDRLKRETRLPPADLERLTRDVSAGLAAAHAAGLVHRDVKPANIWLDATGRAVVLDFGLAKLVADGADGLTDTGAILGTVHYMSPEQAEGLPVDARTDLFSLGAVLYHAATGRRPFTGDSKLAVLVSVKADTPPPAAALNPSLPPPLAALIGRLLSKNPADRPPSADAVLAAPALPARRRRWRRVAVAAWLVAGALGLAALAADRIVVRDKEGKVVAEVPLPEGGSVDKVDGQGKVTPVVVPPPAVAVGGRSPFDALDPARIPAAERFPWQPKELVAVLGEHRQRYWGSIGSLTVSADGKRVAAYVRGRVGTPVVWDLSNQREITRITSEDPLPIGFMPDGKLITQYAVWDISGAEPRKVHTFPESVGNRVAFSPDGKYAVGSGGPVRIWDMGTEGWTVRHTFPDTVDAAISPNGSTLAVLAANTGRVALYSMAERVPRLAGEVPIPALAQSANGVIAGVAGFVASDRLVTTDGKTLRLWKLGGPQPLLAAEATSAQNAFAFAPAADRFCCYAGNSYTGVSVQIWHTTGDRLTLALNDAVNDRHASNLNGLQLTPDGKIAVTAHINGSIRFWEVGGKTLTERQPLAIQPMWYRFALSGRHLLARTEAGHFGLRGWEFGGPAPSPLGDPEELFARGQGMGDQLSPAGDRFAIASGGKFALGRVRDGKVTKTHAFPHDANTYGAWSGDGKRYAVVVANNLLVYDVTADTPRLLAETATTGITVAHDFTRQDGSRFLVRYDSKTRDESLVTFAVENAAVREVSRVAIPKAFYPGHLGPVQSLSPDGRTLVLAAGPLGSGLRVYDVTGDTPRVKAEGDFGISRDIRSVFVTADNKTVAFAADGRVGLLCLERRRVLREWSLPDTPRQVAVTADGRHLVTGNPNGTIYVLRLDAPR